MAKTYLYKITNNKNGRFYYGVHTTDNPNDGYMGSGKLIKQAISKYGKESFTKEIIESFEDESEAYKKEEEIVGKNLIENRKCYNITVGGNKPPISYGEDHHNSVLTNAEREEICRIYKKGKSTTKIAEIYGCSKVSVCNVLKSNNVDIRVGGSYGHNNGSDHHMWIEKDEREICNRYKKGESSINIANSVGVSDVTIVKVLKRHDIKLRKANYYTSNTVLQIEDGQVINEYPSVNQAKKETKIYHIGRVCKGTRKTAGGYEWKYKSDMR